MRKFIFSLITLIYSFNLNAQFTDNFSDGNFNTNPVWEGDTAKFEIDSLFQLHLNAPAQADTAYLVTASQSINNAVWEFYISFLFNPSSSNYAKVYIVSDNKNIKKALRGYFVKIGNTSDEVSLYRQDGLTETKIIDGRDGRLNSTNVVLSVKVTRDSVGNWQLFSDTLGGTNYFLEGTVNDNKYFQTNWFGIYCKYTQTRSTKFYFDNFNVTGKPYIDTVAPFVDSIVVFSSSQLDLYFNETININSAQNVNNYNVNNGINKPFSAIRDSFDSTLVHLTFLNNFLNGTNYILSVDSIKDLAGNIMTMQNIPFTYIFYSIPKFKDIVINEIMADPTPPVSLPETEFIEIYNTTNNYYQLKNWIFTDQTSTAYLPSYTLAPGSYLILCSKADTSLFKQYGNVLGLTDFPSLNNSGDFLQLKDNNANIIDEINYDLTWYHNDQKDAGGWTLELIDPSNPCGEANNWSASKDPKGGTPGKINSVFANNPDITPPQLVQAYLSDSVSLTLVFSEKIDSIRAINANYSFNDNNFSIISVLPFSPDKKSVKLTVTPYFVKGIKYSITVSGITDCIGNLITNDNIAYFAIPEQGYKGDIVINEILFNPRGNGSDFVEIYNKSLKNINLRDWQLANKDNDTIANNKSILNTPYVLFPGEFAVLTKDGKNIKKEYPNSIEKTFIEMESMPSYNNDKGTVILISNLNEIIDSVTYTEDMQFPLLNSFDGVSLERINYNRPSNDKTNWHSASEDVGFATPGFENSQYQEGKNDNNVTVSPKIFSPDNDGIDDNLIISYKFNEPGYLANIVIYDAKGRIVKNLIKNELLGSEGSFSWNGIDKNNEKARVGIYILYFEVFNLSGDVKKYKKTFVLATKF